jgi:hypothetical protein
MKSRGSSTSLVHIHTAPVVPESKSAKQNTAISRVLKKQAVVEAAAGMRDKKIKHFLSKYCCPDHSELLVSVFI